MRTKAIIFDKDGTLLDFDSFWVMVTRNVIVELKKEMKAEQVSESEILKALGVENDITNIRGVLCCGTYAQLGEIMHDILKKYGCNCTVEEVTEFVIDSYYRNCEKGIIRPTCDNICEVLGGLKKLGVKIAVVTTDKKLVTEQCLQTLGIDSFIDRVYTDDDDVPAKPDPYCIFDFLKREGLERSEIVMVGDTLTDTTFAKNGGIRVIGVAKSDENKEILTGEADVIIPDISHIFEVLE